MKGLAIGNQHKLHRDENAELNKRKGKKIKTTKRYVNVYDKCFRLLRTYKLLFSKFFIYSVIIGCFKDHGIRMAIIWSATGHNCLIRLLVNLRKVNNIYVSILIDKWTVCHYNYVLLINRWGISRTICSVCGQSAVSLEETEQNSFKT